MMNIRDHDTEAPFMLLSPKTVRSLLSGGCAIMLVALEGCAVFDKDKGKGKIQR